MTFWQRLTHNFRYIYASAYQATLRTTKLSWLAHAAAGVASLFSGLITFGYSFFGQYASSDDPTRTQQGSAQAETPAQDGWVHCFVREMQQATPDHYPYIFTQYETLLLAADPHELYLASQAFVDMPPDRFSGLIREKASLRRLLDASTGSEALDDAPPSSLASYIVLKKPEHVLSFTDVNRAIRCSEKMLTHIIKAMAGYGPELLRQFLHRVQFRGDAPSPLQRIDDAFFSLFTPISRKTLPHFFYVMRAFFNENTKVELSAKLANNHFVMSLLSIHQQLPHTKLEHFSEDSLLGLTEVINSYPEMGEPILCALLARFRNAALSRLFSLSKTYPEVKIVWVKGILSGYMSHRDSLYRDTRALLQAGLDLSVDKWSTLATLYPKEVQQLLIDFYTTARQTEVTLVENILLGAAKALPHEKRYPFFVSLLSSESIASNPLHFSAYQAILRTAFSREMHHSPEDTSRFKEAFYAAFVKLPSYMQTIWMKCVLVFHASSPGISLVPDAKLLLSSLPDLPSPDFLNLVDKLSLIVDPRTLVAVNSELHMKLMASLHIPSLDHSVLSTNPDLLSLFPPGLVLAKWIQTASPITPVLYKHFTASADLSSILIDIAHRAHSIARATELFDDLLTIERHKRPQLSLLSPEGEQLFVTLAGLFPRRAPGLGHSNTIARLLASLPVTLTDIVSYQQRLVAAAPSPTIAIQQEMLQSLLIHSQQRSSSLVSSTLSRNPSESSIQFERVNFHPFYIQHVQRHPNPSVGTDKTEHTVQMHGDVRHKQPPKRYRDT